MARSAPKRVALALELEWLYRRHSAQRSNCHGMIAADDQGEVPGPDRLLHRCGQQLGILDHMVEITGMSLAFGGSGHGRAGDVTDVDHREAHRLESGHQTGDSHRAGAHVNTPVNLSEILRRADQFDSGAGFEHGQRVTIQA